LVFVAGQRTLELCLQIDGWWKENLSFGKDIALRQKNILLSLKLIGCVPVTEGELPMTYVARNLRRCGGPRTREVPPVTGDLARGQQQIADRFRALGLLPVDIKVSDAVWRAGV
jgi:hypothetical protein